MVGGDCGVLYGGRLISAILSHLPNVSDCLHGGFVVYTKEHKAAALGVNLDLLKQTGSVTEEVARQMAQGAITRSVADVALSVTGVLGPGPDEDGNPPGSVVIGVCQRGKLPLAQRFSFPFQHPDDVRRQTVVEALNTLRSVT